MASRMRELSDRQCACGCGLYTYVARDTDKRRGIVKGQPMTFRKGHSHARRSITDADYRVEDRGYHSPCWIWVRNIGAGGYGIVRVSGREMVAHRAMWIQANGPIPAGLVLDHLCRQPDCIRPEHCEPVSHTTNVRRGNRTKLSLDDVAAIRKSTESRKVLAERYGVHSGTISRVRAARPDRRKHCPEYCECRQPGWRF